MDIAAELATLMGSITHGLIIVSDDGLGNESSEVVIRVPANTFDSKSNVGSAQGVVTNANIGSDKVGLLLGELVGMILRALARKTREVLLGELDQLLVRNATSTSENHAVSCIVVLDVADQLGSGDITDVLAGAENRATQRLLLESGGVKMVKDNFFDLLLDFLRLPQDNITLTLDRGFLKLGVL